MVKIITATKSKAGRKKMAAADKKTLICIYVKGRNLAKATVEAKKVESRYN